MILFITTCYMNFLIIEDDLFLASKLKNLFYKRNLTNIVNVVNNYIDFLEHISTINIYDIILLDINLWDKYKNGSDIIRIIREKNKIIPIIIVSWIDDVENMDNFFSMWASDYIIKPFRFPELEVRVLKWLKNGFLNTFNHNSLLVFYNWLFYDYDKNEFFFNWININLTKKNKYLLFIFFYNKERFLSKDFLINKLFWDYSDFNNKNIRICIYRLRFSLSFFWLDTRIKNIRWEWYIFEK